MSGSDEHIDPTTIQPVTVSGGTFLRLGPDVWVRHGEEDLFAVHLHVARSKPYDTDAELIVARLRALIREWPDDVVPLVDLDALRAIVGEDV